MVWQIVLAVIPILVSGFFAWQAQQASAQASRLQQLEERLAERKFEVYEPLVELFATMLDPQTAGTITTDIFVERIRVGATWLGVFGSDRATLAFQRLMQCSYASAPHRVLIRAYADFVVATRVDMGHPDTKLSAIDLMGIRIKDVYTSEDFHAAFTSSFDDLCAREDWTPPWKRTPGS